MQITFEFNFNFPAFAMIFESAFARILFSCSSEENLLLTGGGRGDVNVSPVQQKARVFLFLSLRREVTSREEEQNDDRLAYNRHVHAHSQRTPVGWSLINAQLALVSADLRAEPWQVSEQVLSRSLLQLRRT